MIVNSWHSVVDFRLNLGISDQLQDIIFVIKSKYEVEDSISKSKLLNKVLPGIFKNDDKLYEKVEEICRYVPYRLLAPFYPEIVGEKDYKKNDLIKELSQKDRRAIYKIEKDKVKINSNWYDYIKNNLVIILGWFKNKLIGFLQSRNPNVPSIPYKISPTKNRNLRYARKYWKSIISRGTIKEIYGRRKIDAESDYAIDHFIPWSFVMHDKLWNLNPTLNSYNSKKRDMIPDLDIYLDRFCELQYKSLIRAIKSENISDKILEDYLEVKEDFKFDTLPEEDHFKDSLKETLTPLYQIAKNQGFRKWRL